MAAECLLATAVVQLPGSGPGHLLCDPSLLNGLVAFRKESIHLFNQT